MIGCGAAFAHCYVRPCLGDNPVERYALVLTPLAFHGPGRTLYGTAARARTSVVRSQRGDRHSRAHYRARSRRDTTCSIWTVVEAYTYDTALERSIPTPAHHEWRMAALTTSTVSAFTWLDEPSTDGVRQLRSSTHTRIVHLAPRSQLLFNCRAG